MDDQLFCRQSGKTRRELLPAFGAKMDWPPPSEFSSRQEKMFKLLPNYKSVKKKYNTLLIMILAINVCHLWSVLNNRLNKIKSYWIGTLLRDSGVIFMKVLKTSCIRVPRPGPNSTSWKINKIKNITIKSTKITNTNFTLLLSYRTEPRLKFF